MKTVLLAIGGVVAAAVVAAAGPLAPAPFASLAPGTVVLYVGHCPFSWRSFQNLQGSPPEVRERVVPVPVAGQDRVVREVCPVAVAALRRQDRRFWLQTGSSLCQSLVADATRFHGRQLSTLPALSVGGQPVDVAAEEMVGRVLGLDLSRDEQGGYLFRAGAPAAKPRRPPADVATEQRSNQPLDW